MTPSPQPWSRHTGAARRAAPGAADAPAGFATRVAAQALAAEPPPASLLECWSLRALALAGLLAVGSLAGNYATLVSAWQNEAASVDDPVAELIELAT